MHIITALHSTHDCQQHTTVSLKEVAGYPIPHPSLPELIFPSDSNCVECTFEDHPWRYFTGGLQGSASTQHLDQELDSLFLSTTSWLMDPAEYRRRSRSAYEYTIFFSLDRMKALRWWAANALSDIPEIVCGLRDDKRRIVQTFQYIKTNKLPTEYAQVGFNRGFTMVLDTNSDIYMLEVAIPKFKMKEIHFRG